MKPTARRRLGKYVLLGRLGHGGMGKIYLAHAAGPAGIEKLLVVKRLHSHLTGDPVLVSNFLDEARLSMALNHPNIGHTFDVGEVDGRYFMVMEYIDGQNLGVVLRMAKRSGKYPKSSLWGGLFLGVLDGLHAAHTARDARGRALHIIHRDVSPQNILLTYEGLPKLVDFGIAKAAMRVQETDAGTLKGKYAYMSPEQVRGEPLDARSDVFAAGIVLWEMLAGRRLYKADSIVKSVERILGEPLVSPVRVNPECHPELAKITLKALQKDKHQRFGNAEEFKDALEDALVAVGERYRPQMGKELMQRLFKDVIDKQRAVLEACLNQTGEVVDDGGDDDDRRSAGDSQSDLRMPRVAVDVSEGATTPSAARRSPLVTAEGDLGPPVLAPPRERETSVQRPPRAQASSASASSSSSSSSSAAASAAVTPPSLESVLAPPLAETTAPQPAPERRSPWVPLLAATVGVVFAVVGVFGWQAWHAKDDVVTTLPPRVAPAVVDNTVNAVDAGAVAALVVDAGASADATVDAGAVVAVVDAGVAVAVDDTDVAEDEDDLPSTPSTSKPKKPKKPKKPEAAPPTTNTTPTTTTTTTTEPKADSEGEGFLTLDTVPWTTVYLGKKKLGETPLVRVAVPAGTLELTLLNPESNIKEAYFARVKPGETFSKRLDLRN